MTCRDFESQWNELIDAEAAGPSRATVNAVADDRARIERERDLVDHATTCPGCGQLANRYQGLRRALQVLGTAPAPPDGFADRVLAEVRAPRLSPGWRIYGQTRHASWRSLVVAVASIAAAAMLASALLKYVSVRLQPDGAAAVAQNHRMMGGGPSEPETNSDPVDSRAFNLALADATAASWELARSASEPAARISLQMLAAIADTQHGPAQPSSSISSEPSAVAVPSLDALAPDAAAAGEMLQQVGERVATGARPFSETARHAFGFLIGPAVAQPDVPAHPPAPKGA
jgi:hypothetical protein